MITIKTVEEGSDPREPDESDVSEGEMRDKLRSIESMNNLEANWDPD